jgi:amino acid transporter/nucleotide-binding universal stress UspA family protein
VKKFETEVRLSREMTLMDATMIGVGAMIGAGIFVLTGIAAGVAGPALILAFLLNGFVALLTAMSYAELGSCYHDAGGGYLWVKEGLPRWNGFLSGWMSWFAHAVACSVYALGFGAYFDHVLRELGTSLPQWGFLPPHKLLSAGIAILFGYINFRGASETGKIGNLVTMAKIVILVIFIGFGLEILLKRGNWQEAFTPFFANGFGGVIKAMGLTFIAFQGFEVISQCSEELKSPKKNIPRAVFLSLLIVVPIYLLVSMTALGTVRSGTMTPWDYLASYKEIALVEVAKTFFAGGGIMLLFGGLISTMSALNATIYSSSRVAFAMGRDRNFPAFFSKVHKKNFTPHRAIIVSLVIIVGMAVALPIEDVASAADIMFLLLFLQVNIAMIRLRKRRADLDRGFVTPLFPYLSIVGIAVLLFLAVYMFSYSPLAWVFSIVWISLGLFVYKGYASKREVEYVHKVKALQRLEQKQYRILLCISKPSLVQSLTQVAVALAKNHNAEIIPLHIIEVGDGKPLLAGVEEKARVMPILEETLALIEKQRIRKRPVLEVAHRISQAILETAQEENCNFIILGRQKQPTMLERFFSSTIDNVIREAPCEVAVLHGSFRPEKISRILIPFGRNIHTHLATEIAPRFAEYFSTNVRIVFVSGSEAPAVKERDALKEIRELTRSNSLTADLEVVRNPDIAAGVIGESKKSDLIIMGGQSGDFLELLFRMSLTREITERAKCPVLWVKEYEERASFWASLFTSHIQENEEYGRSS